jgi:nickel-dependent lactate racemase
MFLDIPYGSEQLRLEMEEGRLSLNFEPPKTKAYTSQREIEDAFWQAANNPIDAAPLSKMVHKGDKVIILVDNFARATPAYLILPPLLCFLETVGAKAKIIIASGALWEMNSVQLEAKLGRQILESGIEVLQNKAREPKNYKFVGITRLGTPIWIHKEFAEADVRIGIGLTQVNLWGYGGGGKIVLPGVCSYETIEWNHKLSTAAGSSFGVLPDSNPIRQDIEEAAEIAGLQFAVNVILNSQKEIVDFKAGKPRSVHGVSVAKYNDIYSYKVKERADISISGSLPWDTLFAHACWAGVGLDGATKDGGTMILASPSPDGLGHIMPIRKYMPASGESLPQAFMDFYYRRAEFWDGVIWYKLLEVLTRKELIVVTQPKNFAGFKEISVKAVCSMEEALNAAYQKHGKNASLAFVPFAKWCVPLPSAS